MPSHLCWAGVVIYAKDKDKVAEFYRQTLALKVEVAELDFTLLGSHGIEVTVVRMPDAIASDITISSPPAVRESTPVKASFWVVSLDAVREAAVATGGSLKPPESAWSWRGALHLDGCDPEGNVVQFRCSDA